MKQRIQFKSRPPKEYTSLGTKLICRGVEVLEFPTPKQAKLAAERWNAKHEKTLQQCQ